MNVSLYIDDGVMRRVDHLVARRAAEDRERGLTGRAVTNRSKLIEGVLRDFLDEPAVLSRETIEYAVVTLSEQFGASRVWLFGSYARGEATEESDVDILLEKGAIKGLEVLDFQDALAEQLGRPVDVVTTAGASERFLKRIHDDEVLLYEAV